MTATNSIKTDSIGDLFNLETGAATQSPFEITNILIYAIIALFIALIAMEVFRPFKRVSGKIALASFQTNTTAFLFNNIILSLFSASSLFLLAQQYSSIGLLAGLKPGPLKWVLSFILFDLALYVWHFLNHHFECLWRFHKIHHSDQSFNVTTGFRFHVFDMFIELIYKSIIILVLGIDAYTILVCELIKTLFVMFHHCNISFPGERSLSKFIIVPFLHRTHHSALRSEHDSNYGIVLSVWDRFFGTRLEVEPKKIGLEIFEAHNFTQLFCLAFITERRLRRLLFFLPKSK